MIIRGNRAAMEKKAAWILAENLQNLLTGQRRVVLAVCGGRSVAGIFRHLAGENVDWEKVHIFMVDERLLPSGHPDSNFRLVGEHLGNVLSLATVHPFAYIPDREGQGAREYTRELGGLGGRFDIVLLSSGEDGHIASIFPGHSSVLDESDGYLPVLDAPKPPPARMSASIRLLRRSRVGLLVFFGRKKREALKTFLDDTVPLADCPARLVGLLPEHYILTDQEAGS
jgi:6-phosphogluconolactonase